MLGQRVCVDGIAANRRFALLGLLALGGLLVFTGPALAQDGTPTATESGGAAAANPVCSDSSGTLANMIEGFVQITTALGLMGLLVVWQADSLAEMFALTREQKAAIKRHKRGALKSATVLVVLGPLFTVAASAMGLPVASCVDLIPF